MKKLNVRKKLGTLPVIAALLLSSLLGGAFTLPSAQAETAVSGFVYEAVQSNRIEGARVTLYDTNGGGRTVWIPEEPEQSNPVGTDREGSFFWKTCPRAFGIGVELAGHKTVYAAQTELRSTAGEYAIPVVTTQAPEIARVIRKHDNICVEFTQYMDLRTVTEDTLVFYHNGKPVDGERWPADSEISGTNPYVYYAKSFNFLPEAEVSEITVQRVKNYAGISISGKRSVPASAFVPETYFTPGDIDNDGTVTAADARIALRASVGIFTDGDKTYDFSESSRTLLIADRDKNGAVEASDARSILRAAVGLTAFYSNSKLATYTNLTDKHDDRTQPIDRITIHHMSDVMTAKGCCDYFCETTREVSANYCIGWDGSVALNVEERYRAWTSSSEANDMRAITIEVSNDSYGPDWHVSDAAMEKLIELCIDVCRRNDIKELVFTENAYGSITMHKMFSDTDCPGPYLSAKYPYIVERVNSALRGNGS